MATYIQSFLHDLIFTHYFAFILCLILLYVIYLYVKIWPKIVVVRILNNDNRLIDLDQYKVKYYINGKVKEMSENPLRLKKWCGIAHKCGVSVKIPTSDGSTISKSEIKRLNRLNYFDFSLSKEESQSLKPDKEKLKCNDSSPNFGGNS